MASGEVAMLFEALPDQETPERLGGGAPRLRYAERGQIEWRPFANNRKIEIALIGHNLADEVVRNAASLNKDLVVLPGRSIRLALRYTTD